MGIEIIDRGAGRAVDELTIDLPDEALLDLLVSEVHDVEGVDVEDVRPLGRPHEDLAVMALEIGATVAAAAAAGSPGDHSGAKALVDGALQLLHADWVAMADLGSGDLVAGTGDDLPNAAWVCGFVRGATATEAAGGDARAGLEHLAVAAVPSCGCHLVVSRDHLPLRGRERALLAVLGARG